MPETEPSATGATPPPPSTAASSRIAIKPSARVLACVLCQQRKVKCDRKFPCANCTKAGAQCVPAALTPRQRRRRFPERELLDRLRHYEDLLRRHNIDFEPLHGSSTQDRTTHLPLDAHDASPAESAHSGQQAEAHGSLKGTEPRQMKSVNFWSAMNQRPQKADGNNNSDDDDDDEAAYHSDSSREDVREAIVREAMDEMFDGDKDRLLFGSPKTDVNLSTLHPEQIQIFKLWQIYLERVDPILKVTHNPTLQVRIIDAAGDITNVSSVLEALMFSIYFVAIMSLDDDECQTLLRSDKKDLLSSYRFACQQALQDSAYLRTVDRDCLTALFLYLVGVRPGADPRTLSPISALAIRIAERMGINNEYGFAKCSVLEAEMRRRLWWSMVHIDTRIGETSAYKTIMLDPTWDCKPPLNANDLDLRPEMKTPPANHARPTEALFTAVRAEMSDFVRHCAFHLDFVNPILKPIAKDVNQTGGGGGTAPKESELALLTRTLEDKYLKFCDPDNPLHFMTIWTTRSYLAKYRVLEHYAKYSGPDQPEPSEAARDAALSLVMDSLRCDTQLMGSPLTRRYRWFNIFQFPFPAYVHLIQDVRRRPACELAAQAWAVLDENYKNRFFGPRGKSPSLKIFGKHILGAWAARQAALSAAAADGDGDGGGGGAAGGPRQPEPTPAIVDDIRTKLEQMTPRAQDTFMESPDDAMGMNMDGFAMPVVPTDFANQGLMSILGAGAGGGAPESAPDPTAVGGAAGGGGFHRHPLHGHATFGFDVNQHTWPGWGWPAMHRPGW